MSLAEMKSKIEELFPKEMDMGYSERFLKKEFLLATYIATGIV